MSEANQKERATRLASLLAESLALPMYEFNILAVEAGVKALESHEEVRRVRVSDSTGKVIVDSSSMAQNGEILLNIEKKIIHKTAERAVEVGTIELAFSRNGLDAELYNLALRNRDLGRVDGGSDSLRGTVGIPLTDASAGGNYRWPRSAGCRPDLYHLAAAGPYRRIRTYDNGNASLQGRHRRTASGRAGDARASCAIAPNSKKP